MKIFDEYANVLRPGDSSSGRFNGITAWLRINTGRRTTQMSNPPSISILEACHPNKVRKCKPEKDKD